MGFGTDRLKRWIWLCVPVAVLVYGQHVALCQKQPAANEASSVAWRAPEGKAGDYVGPGDVRWVPPDQAKQFAKTVHAMLNKQGRNTEQDASPAMAQARRTRIIRWRRRATRRRSRQARNLFFAFHGTPEERTARCMRCHSTSKDQELFNSFRAQVAGCLLRAVSLGAPAGADGEARTRRAVHRPGTVLFRAQTYRGKPLAPAEPG